jgi:hypothetical protein
VHAEEEWSESCEIYRGEVWLKMRCCGFAGGRKVVFDGETVEIYRAFGRKLGLEVLVASFIGFWDGS